MKVIESKSAYMLYYGITLTCSTGFNKANQTALLVSRPPVFIFLCGRAVIIHYSLCMNIIM